MSALRMRLRAAASGRIAAAGCAVFATALNAQTAITTDSSWGRTPGTLVPSGSATTVAGNRGIVHNVPGNLYTIPENLGALSESKTNLFHSFQAFSVGTGDAAVFRTATPTVRNVISRVSGASATQINGLLALIPENGGAPNFFLINPAGMTFGAGARVDVPAAFHVSTANHLRLGDTLFKAGDGSDSTLTSAPPEAFGFLGGTRVSLSMKRGAALSAAPGQALSVIAGDVSIDGAHVVTDGGGDIRVAAVGQGKVDVPVTTSLPAVRGNVEIVSGGSLLAKSVGSADGGSIWVSAGDVLIDGRRSGATFTGIATVPSEDSSAAAGPIHLVATGHLRVLDGGVIESQTYANGRPGAITISAQNLTLDSRGNVDALDSQGVPVPTGVVTCACAAGGPANAGNISVSVGDRAEILDGAGILSQTHGAGSAGSIHIDAGNLLLDGRDSFYADVMSVAIGGAAGQAGDIVVALHGVLSMLNGAQILTQNESQAVDPLRSRGDVTVSVAREATILGGSWIASLGLGTGSAGSIAFDALDLLLDGQDIGFAALMSLAWNAYGNAADIAVTIGRNLVILNGARISSEINYSVGEAGRVSVSARSMTIDGHTLPTGIFSRVVSSIGNAGGVAIEVDDSVSLYEGGEISSVAFASLGNSGTVDITAGSLYLDGRGTYTPIKTGLAFDSSGDSGSVTVDVAGTLTIRGIAEISSNTFGAGPAGSVDVHARKIVIEGDIDAETGIGAGANPYASGRASAGSVTVSADEDIRLNKLGYISIIDQALGDGPRQARGELTVIAPRITLTNDSRISAETIGNGAGSTIRLLPSAAGDGDLEVSGDNTSRIAASTRLFTPFELHVNNLVGQPTWAGTGDGGDVQIEASSLRMSGVDVLSVAGAGSMGDAGRVSIVTSGDVAALYGTRIATDTFGVGKAGDVTVRGANLVVDSSEISSNAKATALGDAGRVNAALSGRLMLRAGGAISSSTESATGRAGTITITAAEVAVAGAPSAITAAATTGSSGQTGNVTIAASRGVVLSEGGELSIRNDATVAAPGALSPTLLRVSAPNVVLRDARITAESTGNVAASDIRVDFVDRLVVDPSSITTSANLGNGGDIDILGPGILWLDHSQISTSTRSGNGGDIRIRAGTLLMETGFIQANSGGAGTAGGNVSIVVEALLSSGSSVSIADPALLAFQPDVFGFNVIQAAAPSGVSGTIDITAPTAGIAGELSGLEAELIETGPLGNDLCRVSAGSSLTPMGRGGLRPSAAGLIRPDRPAAPTRTASAGRRPGSVRLARVSGLDCRY